VSWCRQAEGGDPSSLLSTVEAASGVLGPVLGSLAQERHGHTEESPAKSHKGDEGTGASLPLGKAESWDCSAQRRGGFYPCVQIPGGRVQRGQSQGLFSDVW